MSDDPSDSRPLADRRQFATTQWSIVLAASQRDDADQERDAGAALSQLCESYWYPLYSYVRHRGHAPVDAQDLTQSFFAQLLEKQSLRVADPQRGRFRSFLLASMDHFLANEYDRMQAQKRGGGRQRFSIDVAAGESRLDLTPFHNLTAERIFEKNWALTLLEVVVGRLEREFAAASKEREFELLRDALTGGRERLDYNAIAAELSITPENARQRAHRLRKRYRDLLREEVTRTVAAPGDVDEELASLLAALGSE